jgi:hypothetical protein
MLNAGNVCLHSVVTVISQQETHGTARFVVYCTCAKYRVVEYYRVCRFRDVVLEYILIHHHDHNYKSELYHITRADLVCTLYAAVKFKIIFF